MILAPEIFQLLLIALLFIQSLSDKGRRMSTVWLVPAAALGAVISAFSLGNTGMFFYEAYVVDGVSQFFKMLVAVGYAIAVYNAVRQKTLGETPSCEYFLFMTLSAWGLMILASGAELITIYIALEVSSYSLYALVPLRDTSREASEAAAKYILFGAMSTAVALYGFSYILASQHTTYLSQLALMDWSWAGSPLAVVGLIMFLAGFFFKLALFPFHFWCPDVYQGASNETAAYIATLPKLGAIVVLIRLAAFLKPGLEVTTLIAVLGAISMTYGNISALVQTDLKRILGYSSVAHAGYMTLGLVSGTAAGLAATSFYVLIYILMNLTCFWVICRLSGDGRNLELKDLNGLYRRSPALAMVLAVSAFALVGLPPTAGFMGKLALLTSAWDHGYNWLVVVAAVNAAFAIYYYLNFVRHAYTNETEEGAVVIQSGGRIMAGLLAIAILLIGVLPSPVYQYALAAGKSLLP